MSTCPSKDLHSVYLDNELPEVYRERYEAHVRSCKECQRQLKILKGLHLSLAQDAKEITPDQHFLDQSFERLQVKLKYNNNVLKSDFRAFKFRKIAYFASAAAAVAIFAITVPVRLSMTKNVAAGAETETVPVYALSANDNETQKVAETSTALSNGNAIVISGNIDQNSLYVRDVGNNYRNYGGGTLQNVSTYSGANAVNAKGNIDNIEVFRPEFSNNVLVYRITLPALQ